MRALDPRLREVLWSALVLGLLAFSWMYAPISVPNERSRAYLTIALVDQRTLAIDAPLHRYGAVFDLARVGDHYFTDKAPGASLLGVPVYGVSRLFRPAATDIVDVINLLRTYLMLPLGMFCFWVLRSLMRALALSEVAIDISSLGFMLGSSVFHYAGAFYGHVPVALCVLCALRCLCAVGLFTEHAVAQVSRSSRRRNATLLAAGLFAGLAGLIEYQAIPLAALLALPILWQHRAGFLRELTLFVIGGAPCALALLAYNAHAFGSGFALGYQHLVGSSLQELHGAGFVGATWPRASALVGLLFSQHRGLLLTCPLLGLGLFALPFGFRFMPRALFVTCVSCCAYLLLIVASSSVWFGGWSFGPRLLVPIMGPLALSAAFITDAMRSKLLQLLVRAFAIAGILYNQIVQATFSELPPEFTRPLVDSALPLLRAALPAPNLACKFSALGSANLWPLGLLVVLACLSVALRGSRDWLHATGALFVGVALVGGMALAPSSLTPAAQLRWRGQVQAWSDHETRCLAH
jgi:hypothetical protein